MDRRDTEKSVERLKTQHQSTLAIVDDADGPVHVTELAERLVKQGEAVMNAEAFEAAVERKLIALHHDVLPRLAQSDVIFYDHESNTVSPRSDEKVQPDWMDEASLAEALSNLGPDGPTDSDTIGVLHGRQAAIEYGRTLADEANDELFCMYVSTDLLEDECIQHAADAIDRGVELYMGSRNEDVRDLTRRHLPEATIWEPQRGWLHAPVGYPKVGRFVFVDRRKVMFAIMDEPGPDGEHPEEKAIVGEGEENPLVVLVRDLLGPRLVHLDRQSTDFHSRLHS